MLVYETVDCLSTVKKVVLSAFYTDIISNNSSNFYLKNNNVIFI
jgi:hypothetical protein